MPVPLAMKLQFAYIKGVEFAKQMPIRVEIFERHHGGG